MSKEKYYDSEELKALICGKYPSPAWVVLNELREGTGFFNAREADAVAFGTWPSRGFQIIGFECKSNRGDWLQELRRPEKAEGIASYCDQWWVVCAKDIAKLEEMPKTWGWLAPRGNGLTVLKQAEEMKPSLIDNCFLASIVRNIQKNYTPNSMVKLSAENQAKHIANNLAYEAKNNLEKYDKLQIKMQEFKEASGINLEDEWRHPIKDIGKIVRAVLDRDLTDEIKSARKAYKQAKDALEGLESVQIFKNVIPDIEDL